MHIHVTEHKSVGKLRPLNGVVRVFVDRDYHYGYWVPENIVFEALDPQQQSAYLQAQDGIELDVSPEVAQRLIDQGNTPFAKRRVA